MSSSASSQQRHIIVVGAGVTGLTSANFLAEAGYLVTIVAKHVPGELSIEYTSPWAGAHWRTAATTKTPREGDWDVQTYKYLSEILGRDPLKANELASTMGIKAQDSFHYWDDAPDDDLWWAPHVKEFQQVSINQDPVKGINARTPADHPKISWAARNRAMSINTPRYLVWLRDRGAEMGVQLIQAKLPSDRGLSAALAAAEREARQKGRPKADAFVNATGLAAGKLCGDKAVIPIRGQTVLVKGEASGCRTRKGEGYSAYCIPRPGSGTTILGGTREEGSWNAIPDPEVIAEILRRARWQVPELLTSQSGDFEIISVQCGLRPGRHGGPRVEKETVGGSKVVHSYGHDGSGYQNSVGSARLVVKLMNESLGGTNARL